jgi:hypothetical protein
MEFYTRRAVMKIRSPLSLSVYVAKVRQALRLMGDRWIRRLLYPSDIPIHSDNELLGNYG